MATEKKYTIADALSILLVPVLFYADGFTLSKLWTWHVAAVFHLPEIGIGHAVGLSAFVSLVRYKAQELRNEDGPFKTCMNNLLICGMLLLVGYLAR
jgi:hypothetical protein